MKGGITHGKEKPAEKKLIKAFKDLGFWAAHMNTDIDGFLDILVKKNGKAFLLEAKDGRRTSLAVNLFEPTQPVFIEKWVKAGGTAYLVTERDGEYEVYNAASSLVLSLKDPSLLVTELPGVCCGTAAEVALDLATLWGLL